MKNRYIEFAKSHPNASAGFLIGFIAYTEAGKKRDEYIGIINERINKEQNKTKSDAI